ncbi:YeiH family protein [Pelosinus baikalensis]|uniref:YeiH family protein n=1 Tax=Pelosinus baikalensis TaxID=2892015 RepID=A0ABS8HMI1_9FIRM|nr:YeiH family protein [Pelosinus baikalensis]MCC5463856.1 YeiH family protein [Pelosinus baikalensis]
MIKNNLFNNIMPGAFIVTIIAIPAWFLGTAVPLMGGPIFGILFGMILAFLKRPASLNFGISFTAKKVLQYAIILLGFEMNLIHVFAVGSQSLLIMISTISAALITAWLVGRYLRLTGNVNILIGVGTAICGGSAIAAAAPVIAATDKEVAYSISTIFLFNIAAVFIFPFLGHIFRMNDMGFGMWAGTAINDTSSVVAAGYSYSQAAGNFATIVKLTRTLMIVPITIALAILTSRKAENTGSFSFSRIFPWFIFGFIFASIINTIEFLPSSLCLTLAQIGKFFIVMAMVAIGLNTHLKQLIGNGIKPIFLGLSCWIAVAIVSLAVQHYLHIW